MPVITFLPLDDRPCSTLFPSLISKTAGAKLDLIENISELEKSLESSQTAVLSIDRFIYGGLVESRKPDLSSRDAKGRMSLLADLLKNYDHPALAFTVLMRQAPSAFTAKEEKTAGLVKQASFHANEKEKLQSILCRLPEGVWQSYLGARKRNLQINLQAIRLVKKRNLDFLAVALDDLSHKGLNQKEKESIGEHVRQEKLSHRIEILPGTDEIGLLLLAKSLLKNAGVSPSIFPVYSHSNPDRFKLRYEDCSISQLVKLQIKLIGGKVSDDPGKADFLLFIHTPQEDQEDVPLHPVPGTNPEWFKRLRHSIEKGYPCVLADLRYANGADLFLMRKAAEDVNLSNLLSYSAWNTAANALGIALSHGSVRWQSIKKGTKEKESSAAHQKFLFLRFLEDWFYQAEIRPAILEKLRNQGISTLRLSQDLASSLEKEIKKEMTRLVASRLSLQAPKLRIEKINLPWKRLFELSIEFETENARRSAIKADPFPAKPYSP